MAAPILVVGLLVVGGVAAVALAVAVTVAIVVAQKSGEEKRRARQDGA
jgi:hypothetical protein